MKPGTLIDGKYRIEAVLGQGGMGAVYRAWHLGTERHVALKVLLPTLQNSREAVDRFQREARAAGRLKSPHIVGIFDFGTTRYEDRTVYYLAMEYLHGSSLRQFLKDHDGNLSLHQVVDIMAQIAVAVDTAHELNIIHRDLKPDNIWIEQSESEYLHVKVIDFGIAKLLDERTNADPDISLDDISIDDGDDVSEAPTRVASPILGDGDASIAAGRLGLSGTLSSASATPVSSGGRSQPLTIAGGLVGTPPYMAPEQFNGTITRAVDVYACGVIAYQLLAGRLPRRGSLRDLLVAHAQKAPPPPLELDNRLAADVVFRALAHDPQARPSSCKAFALALRRAAEGESVWRERVDAVPFAERAALFGMLTIPCSVPMTAAALAAQDFGARPWVLAVVWLAWMACVPIAAATAVAFLAATAKERTKRASETRRRLRSSLWSLLRTPKAWLSPISAVAASSVSSPSSVAAIGRALRSLDRRLLASIASLLLCGVLLLPFSVLLRAVVLDAALDDVRRGVTPGMAGSMAAALLALVTAVGPVALAVALVERPLLIAIEATNSAREALGEVVKRRMHPSRPGRLRPTWSVVVPVVLVVFGWFVASVGFDRAVFANSARTVEALLQMGASPNPTMDRQPVHTAAIRGYEDTLAALLAAGADPNAKDGVLGPGTGDPPLSAAIAGGCVPCVRQLLDAGADPKARLRAGDTLLDRALATTGPRRLTLVRMLLDAGIDLDAAGPNGTARERLAADQETRRMLEGVAK